MSEPIVLRIHNPHRHDTLFRVRAHWGGLPEGVQLVVGLAGVPARKDQAVEDSKRFFPDEIDAGCGQKMKIEPSHVYRFAPNEQRHSELPEVLVPARGTAFAAIHIGAMKLPSGSRPRFDIVQMEGNRVVGGCTVEIRESIE